MQKTILTRVGFCPECKKEERAKTGHYFLAYGSNGWHAMKAQQNSRYWGYVPHIYKLDQIIEQNVIVLCCCAIEGCGSFWKTVENDDPWLILEKTNFKRLVYSLDTWNALVKDPYRCDWDYKI